MTEIAQKQLAPNPRGELQASKHGCQMLQDFKYIQTSFVNILWRKGI